MYFESTNIQRATWGSTICIRVQERPLLRCPKGNYSGALGHKVLSLNLISIKQPAPYFDPQFWLFSDKKLLQYVARFFLLATQDFGQCSSCLFIFEKSIVEMLSGWLKSKLHSKRKSIYIWLEMLKQRPKYLVCIDHSRRNSQRRRKAIQKTCEISLMQRKS